MNMERTLSQNKKPIAITVGILLVILFLGYSCSTARSPYEKEYSFPEDGFQAEFPARPKVSSKDGITGYIGGDKYKITHIIYLDDDVTFARDYAAYVEANPSNDNMRNSIEPLLDRFVDYFISEYSMEREGDLSFSDPGAIAPHSGIISFSGTKDFSDYGGSSNQHFGACVAIVFNNVQTYVIFEIRDSVEEAIKAAKTFTLIKGGNSSSKSPTSSAKSESIPNGAISWKDASRHVGKTVTVYGPIVNTTQASSSTGAPTYLDMGAAYPDSSRVSIVIWDEDAHNFSQPPTSMYKGKTVCVTGEVYTYSGACNIKVTSPDQIKILD